MAANRLARRLVWSESDQLPGLVVDQYDDVLVVQTLTMAMSKREKTIVELLVKKTGSQIVLARNDAPVRQLEGLPMERKVLLGDYQAPTRVRIAGIDYDLDLWSGQKTGFYLDQAENYSAGGGLRERAPRPRLFYEPGRLCLERAESGRGFMPGDRSIG